MAKDSSNGASGGRSESHAPQPCDILVRNGFVVTMDEARNVYPAGAVAIEGRRIMAIGPEREIAPRYRPLRTLDAGGASVHPGLIEGHYHSTMHLTRGAVTDDPNQRAVGGAAVDKPALYSRWINAFEDGDEYASALLACTEMLRNGFSFLLEAGTVFEPDTVAEAAEAVGLRASLADPFLWDLTTGTQAADELDRAPPDTKRCLAQLGRELRRNRDPDALVRGHVAIYGSGSASEELQRAAKACADENGVIYNKHQSFIMDDVRHETELHGRAPLVREAEMGLLGANCTYVHMNVLDDDEVEAVAQAGMSVVWHPANFMFYGLGAHTRTRMPELYRRGVDIAFGTDVAKLWTFGELPFVAYLLSREGGDYLSAEQILEMQTISAARAVGLGDMIGSLEPGKRADLVIRTNQLPDAQPGMHPVQEFVLVSRTKSVDTVIVDGEVVLRGGRLTRLDEDVVYEQARASARGLAGRVGLTPGTTWPMVI